MSDRRASWHAIDPRRDELSVAIGVACEERAMARVRVEGGGGDGGTRVRLKDGDG